MQISDNELTSTIAITISSKTSIKTCKTCSSTGSCDPKNHIFVDGEVDSKDYEEEPLGYREHERIGLDADGVPLALDGDSGAPVLPSASTPKSLAYAYPPPPPIYPPVTPILHPSPIQILSTPEKGRGVYAKEDIAVGVTVDISPVLLITKEEYYGGGVAGEGKGVEGSVLRGYVFTWKGKEGGMALALGIGSLFNHSVMPNVSFELNTSTYTIHYKAFRPILAGEELCIFYGHRTRFEGVGDAMNEIPSEIGDDLWGGLDALTAEEETAERARKWDDEIVPFAELGWVKVTSLVNPEDQVLTTFDCYVIDIPAQHAQLAFAFSKSHVSTYDSLSHVKRVRKIPVVPGEKPCITVLLFPVHSAPPDVPGLLASSKLAFLNPKLYTVPIPAAIARTDAQAREWGALWPVQMVHIREGPKALPRAKGWERVKINWIMREAERVWKAAHEAEERGELPVACHVTETFLPVMHSSASLPKTIARAHDTRRSTHNILSHAASNAIDAVAILDRQGLREQASTPSAVAPYLLTGLTVFMSHEPCLLCSMSLLHSRISQLYYIRRAPGSGGCGSLYEVHEDEGLNHKFKVWEWKGKDFPGAKLDVSWDP